MLIARTLDLALSNPGIDSVEPTDPWLRREGLRVFVESWRGSLAVTDPRVSPLRRRPDRAGPAARAQRHPRHPQPRRSAAGRAQPAPVSSKEAAPTKAATTAMDTVRPCWPSCIGRQADTARTIPPRASIYICASGADIWRPIGQEQVRRTADQVAPDSPSCSESRPVDEVRCAPRQFGDLKHPGFRAPSVMCAWPVGQH